MNVWVGVPPSPCGPGWRRCVIMALVLAVVASLPGLLEGQRRAQAGDWQKRWVYVASDLYANENMKKLEDLLRRSRAAGYNGVLFSDVKTFTWWKLENPGRWKANAGRLRKTATDLGLDLVVCVFPFGYSEPILSNDVNLAAGMPIKDAPLLRRGGRLLPVETATIKNGSFEKYSGDRAFGYSLQDDPGKGSFIDTRVFKEGHASLRFENVGAVNGYGHGRIFQKISVQPWQQYRIRVWMKTEHLAAGLVQIVALAGRQPLQYQSLLVPEGTGLRYVSNAKDLTTDWVEQSVTFNSLGNTGVTIGVGVWNGGTGKIWWDDLRVDAVPTLNVLRRSSAPLAVTGENGTVYREGSDFEAVADGSLGRFRWPGTYDTRHEPPRIGVPSGSRIKEGERVRLSCYHPVIFYGGQVGCSLDDPEVFDLCGEEIRRTKEALSPDGYMMSHDEIRCAGWEPSELKNFRTSGELLAYNVRKCYEVAVREGGGKPVYVWSDMYDPFHNAHANYDLVNNTIAGSWVGLDPNVTVMKWGDQIDSASGLRFFSRRGNKLMIAAYYDGDVEKDYIIWKSFVDGTPGITGVMYTTWQDDYSKLEKFADVWWGGGK